MKRLTIVLVIVLGLALPAQGHTRAEYDAWMEEWQENAWENGVTIWWGVGWMEHLEVLWDFIDRHPEPPPLPAPPTVKRSTPSVLAPSIPWNIGAGVEQWRTLVAAHFPASEVERALCIMTFESGGNPNAYNPSTATGLMQVKTFWAAAYGHAAADLFIPEVNIKVAALVQATPQGWNHWSPYKRGECR